MADILTSIAAGGWGFLVAWLLPSAIVVGSWVLIILPRLSAVGIGIPSSWDATTSGLVLGFAIVAIAFILAALSTPLYRILEGYLLWPRRLYASRVAAQQQRKRRLVVEANLLDPQSLQADLAWEKANQYPVSDAQLAPTRLGNALRAMETYAHDRFGLDLQLLWSELAAAAPASLSDAYNAARSQVDFFIALLYLTIVFVLTTVVAVVVELTAAPRQFDVPALVIAVVVGLLLPWLWYQMAVISVSFWRSASQAIVNTGRTALATQLGLVLPATLQQERDMWERTVSLMFYPAAASSAQIIDAYRIKPAPATSAVGDSASHPHS